MRLRNAEFLILVIFLLVNLRVLNWFEPGYLVFGGDFRPPVVPSVFLQNALYSWNEVDWGVPSVYSPRMLDPFFFLMTAFQAVGVNTFISEVIATYSIYVLVTILIYIYIKRLTNGDLLAAFIGALFFTSNIHLVVDREQTAIGFINMSLMILPSVAAFTEGLKRKSLGLMTLAGFFFILTYAAFPNYRAPVLTVITLLITIVALYINRKQTSKPENASYRVHKFSLNLGPKFFKVSFNFGLKFSKVPFNLDTIRRYAKLHAKSLLVFILATLVASLWIIVLIWVNLNSLLSTLSLASNPSSAFANKGSDVVRLIAQWSIYSNYAGIPYVPYAAVYLQNPVMIGLSYVPTVLAFVAIFLSKSRKLAFFFGSLTILFLLLTMGSSGLFLQLYGLFIEENPLMKAFRTSTNWIFLVILGFSVLIGLSVSGLCLRIRKNILKLPAIVLTLALFFSTTYPLITGEVTKNWLDPNTKGAYIPPYFKEAEKTMSNHYWTILLPLRNVYPIYNFTDAGVLASGNPYPIVFSKPFLSGSGTEYMRSTSLDLQNKVHGAIMRGPSILGAISVENVSASSIENDLVPAAAVDLNYATRWASKMGMPQWFEIDWKEAFELSSIKIVFEYAYANEYNIQTWNGTEWITRIEVVNNMQINPEHVFEQPVSTTRLRITFTEALPFNMVSIYELETNPQKNAQTEIVPKLLGMLGIKNLLVEKNIIAGNVSNIEQAWILNGTNAISLIREWNGASMYENKYAQEKIYFADSVMPFSDFFEMCQAINHTEWSDLTHTAFIKSTSERDWSSIGKLQTPETHSWQQISPTSYTINAQANAPFVLAFLENYDSHWKVFVNGKPISEDNHVTVNAFANGWVITSTGRLTIAIEYETQNLITTAALASVVLTVLFAMVIVRKEIRKSIRYFLRKRKQNLRDVSKLNNKYSETHSCIPQELIDKKTRYQRRLT